MNNLADQNVNLHYEFEIAYYVYRYKFLKLKNG